MAIVSTSGMAIGEECSLHPTALHLQYWPPLHRRAAVVIPQGWLSS